MSAGGPNHTLTRRRARHEACAAGAAPYTLAHGRGSTGLAAWRRLDWFESVAEARRRARRRLPRPVFMALEAGAEAGVTRADNVAAFSEDRRFAPPRHDLPARSATCAASVLGTDIALPVIASPVGAQAVHPLGEVAVAQQAPATQGTAMGLSEFASGGATAEEQPGRQPAECSCMLQVHWSARPWRAAAPRRRLPGRASRDSADRHARLVVPRRPGLGEPRDPRASSDLEGPRRGSPPAGLAQARPTCSTGSGTAGCPT